MNLGNLHVFLLIALVSAVSFVMMFRLSQRLR